MKVVGIVRNYLFAQSWEKERDEKQNIKTKIN